MLYKHSVEPKNIPIIINNYNRLTFLQELIQSLTCRGYNNIYIIDNKSTYLPLLDYYKRCPYTIFYLDENLGYKALWQSEVFEKFKSSFYVYTDSDLELSDECPDDFMEKFLGILRHYPLSTKVGFGLRIDDLPDCFVHKSKVIEHESRFWNNAVEPGVFRAEIDTTFALYRPFCKGEANVFHRVYRTGAPYTARHLPWYIDSNNMSAEESYYINSIKKPTHWSEQAKR